MRIPQGGDAISNTKTERDKDYKNETKRALRADDICITTIKRP